MSKTLSELEVNVAQRLLSAADSSAGQRPGDAAVMIQAYEQLLNAAKIRRELAGFELKPEGGAGEPERS